MTGEATYTDDVKLSPDFLHAALVVSSKPYARILSVDPSEALKVGLRALTSIAESFSTAVEASRCCREWSILIEASKPADEGTQNAEGLS